MTISRFPSKCHVPPTVADLDRGLVVAAFARHAYNVSDAALELGVPASDLRRLMWANSSLQDQAMEAVEARLDKAEKTILEALDSEDPRMRMAASMFTIRNSQRAKRRGWITSASASAEVVAPPERIVVLWGDGTKVAELGPASLRDAAPAD